jgi:thiol-disulfide isomerase/thioredoxin
MNRFTRVGWALFGVLALLAGVVGAYFSLHQRNESPGNQSQPAPLATSQSNGGFVFRVHDAPRAVPDLAFEDDAGRKRKLSEFRNKVVLLNIWATWCAPCREEMPALDRLHHQLGGPGFEVLALSIDAGGAAAVKQFYDEIGIRSLAIYVDPGMRAMGGLAVVGLPTTLLLDRQGREIGRRIGPAPWDGPEAVRMISSYMK